MARKRKNLQELDYQSSEYWDKLLQQEGLSTERGRSKRLIYVGGTKVLDDLAGQQDMGTRDKRRDPKTNYASSSDVE
jgi:hypothetical protein